MYYCNLSRSPTFPLISRFPRGPVRLSDDFCSQCIERYSFLLLLRPRKFSNTTCILSAVGVSSADEHSSPNDCVTSSRDGKMLPWIASYRDRGEKTQLGKKNGARPSLSSWKVSADNYFSRNGVKLRYDKKGGRGRRDAENSEPKENMPTMIPKEEEEEVSERTNDQRWNGINNKCRDLTDRRPQFEKPEVYSWHQQEIWGKRIWQQAEESSIPKLVGQGVYGVGPVLAALTVARREFYVLYVQEGLDLSGGNNNKKDRKAVEKILSIATAIGLKVIEASKHDLNMVVDNRPHQGLVLDASPLDMVDIMGLEPAVKRNGRAPLWVALDQVTDPQNLGAITRSAYFFGIEGIVLCAKNSAPLSGVVSKASAGSLELIELRSCKNMMKFLTSSMENGWRVLGGSISSRALPLHEVEVGVPTILVLGNEGSGLRTLVERSCSQLIRVPGNITINDISGDTESKVEEKDHNYYCRELNSFLAVESLNVSVAAGVLLYHFVGEAKKFSMYEKI